jgi:hypothetical protein
MPNNEDHKKILETLVKHGVLNKDINMDRLIATSQEIGRFTGEKAGDWTFISPNYVYKGGAFEKVENYTNVMKVLQSNAIVNKAATLEQIVAVSDQIGGVAARAGEWTFISPNFVYKGGNVAEGVITNPVRPR